TQSAARWWPLPSFYPIELAPFFLCALVDRALKDAQSWERFIVAGIAGFFTSAVACAYFYGGLGAAVFGFFAVAPAAVCSLLSTATDIGDTTPFGDDGADCSRRRPSAAVRPDIY